ncbi:MAG TPA: SBBP repeat-containing protein [Tepidisphaeraceae bacterium]|nr:SBBP repeat-containing protein [Tepidisphaeraceae bacterium]
MTRAAVELLENRRLLTSNLLTLGGSINDATNAVETAPDGGRILAGQFSGTVDFSNPAAPASGNSVLTARGQSDLFVARYAATGALVWAFQIGADAGRIDEEFFYSTVQADISDFRNRVGPTIDKQGEYLSTLRLGSDGNLYIAGSFQGTVDFDGSEAGTVNRRSEGYHDAFIAAYTIDGNFLWASTFGGVFDDTVKDIAITDDGAVIATGYFTREADFNPTKQVKSVVAKGRDDIFVAKFQQTDSAPIARLQWVYNAGGDGVDLLDRDSGEGIALDGSGNVYVTGSFAGEADWDPSRSKLIVEAIGGTDGFLLRLSPRGKLDYIKPFGGERYDAGDSLAIDPQGRIFLTGYFEEFADLDPGPGVANFRAREDGDEFDNNKERQGVSLLDAYVAQIGLRGNLQWAMPIAGDDYEAVSQLRVADNTLIVTGSFAGQIEFNGSTATDTLQSILGDDDFKDDNRRDSSFDAFVARYTADAGTFLNAVRFGGSGDDWGLAIDVNTINNTVESGGIFRNTASFNPNGGNPKRKAVGLQDLFAVSIDLTSELA